jgi:ribonuclease E
MTMVMTRTRSGIAIKKPTEVYTPEMEDSGFVDDYDDSEYDSDFDGSELDTDEEMSCTDDEDEDEDEDDEDEDADMENFIVDDIESETEYSDSDDT